VQTAIFIPQRKQANAVGAVHIFAARIYKNCTKILVNENLKMLTMPFDLVFKTTLTCNLKLFSGIPKTVWKECEPYNPIKSETKKIGQIQNIDF